MRVLIASLSIASMCLGLQAAAEPPVQEATGSSETIAPSATDKKTADSSEQAALFTADKEMSLDELLVLARKQGFTVNYKDGTQRLCRSSLEIGSRLNRTMRCFTPEQWREMAALTRDEMRENARRQSNPDGT